MLTYYAVWNIARHYKKQVLLLVYRCSRQQYPCKYYSAGLAHHRPGSRGYRLVLRQTQPLYVDWKLPRCSRHYLKGLVNYLFAPQPCRSRDR